MVKTTVRKHTRKGTKGVKRHSRETKTKRKVPHNTTKSTVLLQPGFRFTIQGHPIKVENGIFEVTATDFNKGKVREDKNLYFQWRRVNKRTGEPMETNVPINLRGGRLYQYKNYMKIITPNSQSALKQYTSAKESKQELESLLSNKRWELGVGRASHYDVEQVENQVRLNKSNLSRLRKKTYG